MDHWEVELHFCDLFLVMASRVEAFTYMKSAVEPHFNSPPVHTHAQVHAHTRTHTHCLPVAARTWNIEYLTDLSCSITARASPWHYKKGTDVRICMQAQVNMLHHNCLERFLQLPAHGNIDVKGLSCLALQDSTWLREMFAVTSPWHHQNNKTRM